MERERSDSHSWRKLSGKIPGIHPSVFHEFELTLQAPSTLKFSPLGFLKIDLFGRLPRAFESLEYGTNPMNPRKGGEWTNFILGGGGSWLVWDDGRG